MGAKACPIVNEASNVISGISQGDHATALKNAGLLGLYGVAGKAGGSKVAQKSLASTMIAGSAATQALSKSAPVAEVE